jgi:hypothetical protein
MMDCASCGKQKNSLHPRGSNIINGITIIMCQSCIDFDYEPRWTVVLGGRQNGPESIKEYITKRKYLGKIITAEELLS